MPQHRLAKHRVLVPVLLCLVLAASPLVTSIFELIGGDDIVELRVHLILIAAMGLYALWIWSSVTKGKWLKVTALINLGLFLPFCAGSVCLHTFGGQKIWPSRYVKYSVLLFFMTAYVGVICLRRRRVSRTDGAGERPAAPHP